MTNKKKSVLASKVLTVANAFWQKNMSQILVDLQSCPEGLFCLYIYAYALHIMQRAVYTKQIIGHTWIPFQQLHQAAQAVLSHQQQQQHTSRRRSSQLLAAAAAAAAAAASNPTPSSVMYYGHAPHPEHHTPANGELDKSEEQIYESIYDTRWRLMNQVGLKLILIHHLFLSKGLHQTFFIQTDATLYVFAQCVQMQK